MAFCPVWFFGPQAPPRRGAALETVVFHELRVFNETSGKHRPIFYYRTPAGVEVDFVIQTGRRTDATPPRIVAIETKLAHKWNQEWERPLRALASTTQLQVDRLIVVYTGERTYHFGPVEVLPLEAFLQALHRGGVLSLIEAGGAAWGSSPDASRGSEVGPRD